MKIFSSRHTEIADICIGEKSKCVYRLGTEDYVELSFSDSVVYSFGVGSYVDYLGKRYVLATEYLPKKSATTGGYDYTIRFDAWYMLFNHKIVKFVGGSGKETSFTLTADLATHMGILVKNLALLGYAYEGKAYEFDISGVDSKSEAKLVSYESVGIISAIQKLCSKDLWDCEWWVDGNIIHLGKCEFGDTEVDLHDDWLDGVRPNVQSITANSNKAEAVANRYYVFGSDRNIPSNYREDEINEDITISGIVQRRLMLPKGTDYIDAYRYADGKRVYLGEQGYDTAEEMPSDEVVEGVKVLEEIYPRREDEIAEIRARVVFDTIENADGTTEQIPATIYQLRLASSADSGKWFKTAYLLPNGESLRVQFTGAKRDAYSGDYDSDGLLNGMTFDVIFNPDANPEDSVESQWFEVVRNEEYGRMLPDGVLKPDVGDKVVLSNWDISLMETDGMGYIAEAEEELYTEAVKVIRYEHRDANNYDCVMMSDVMCGYDFATHTANEDKALELWLGQRVLLHSELFVGGKRSSRVIGWEKKIDFPYDSPKFVLGEPTADGAIKKLQSEVENLTLKGQIYEQKIGGGFYVIGSNDRTIPSNTNVFSALRTQRQFADKSNDEIIEGIWQFINHLKARNYVGGALGTGWWLGNDGERSYMEVDKLYVRMKAIFDSLEIKHISHVGGEMILSPSGAKIKAVERSIEGAMPLDAIEEINASSFGSDENVVPTRIIYVPSTNKFVGEVYKSGVLKPSYYLTFKGSENYGSIGSAYLCNGKYYHRESNRLVETEDRNAYRCYLTTEDEDEKVVNTFQIGDLVMCKTFNLDAEQQRYYWRYCGGVGADYIDLSDSQYDRSIDNDEPLPQDNIVTIGSNRDSDRQNAILISSYGAYSPSIILYKGIDDFSLDGKAEIQVSPKGNKFKGEFIVQTADGEEYSLVEFLNDRVTLRVNSELYSEECVSNPYPNIQGETSAYTIGLNDNCLAWQQGDKIVVEIGFRCRNTGNLEATLYGEEATQDTIRTHRWIQELSDASGNDIDTTLTAEIEVLQPIVYDDKIDYAYLLFDVNAEYDISYVSIKRKSFQSELTSTGIDIEKKLISLDAQTTQIKNGDKTIALFTTNADGKAVIKAENIDAEQLDIVKLNTKPNNKPHISIEGEQVQIYDADNNVKVKLHGGKLSSASGSDNVNLVCSPQSITLGENQYYAKIVVNTTALVVENSSVLYQMNTINTAFSFTPKVASDSNPIPTNKRCRIRLLRYYTSRLDSAFDIETAEDEEELGVFEEWWQDDNGKTFNPKFSVPNTTYPTGSYKFVLELSVMASVKSGLFQFNPAVEIVGSPILHLQEIAEDGFNFQYGDATKYVVSTADGFEVRHGSYGIRVSDTTGAVYTTDGFQTTNPFGTGGGGTATYPVITATASVSNTSGIPNVNVTKSGGDSNPSFAFAFSGLKGEKGDTGEKGEKGDSASIIIK